MLPLARSLALAALALLLCASAAFADQDIRLTEDGFSPRNAVVDAGEAIHFINETDGTWSVTSDDGLFDSEGLRPGGSYAMSLSVPGTHTYASDGEQPAGGSIRVLAKGLAGDGGDDATARIPALPFPEVEENDIATNPDFGVKGSKTRIIVGVKPGATVEKLNAALADGDVRIIGGLPNMGTLLVQTRATQWGATWEELHETLTKLRRHDAIAYASMSMISEPLSVPRRAEDAAERAPRGWNWDDSQIGLSGTWALAKSRVPEMWNTLEAVKRKRPQIITGIVDTGFEAHEDLPGLEIKTNLCPPASGQCTAIPNTPDADGHGNHVAGIIGAAYDEDSGEDGRSRGVAGANPVAKMYGYSAAGFTDYTPGGVGRSTLADKNLELFSLILRTRPHQLRVINYSMGPSTFSVDHWNENYGIKLCGPGERDDDLPDEGRPVKTPCTPNNLDEWQREIAAIGMAAAPVAREAARQGVMIVQAAGNDGQTFCPGGPSTCQPIDTASRNEFGWASRHWEEPFIGGGLPNPILQVQAYQSNEYWRLDTTFGGDVAAPGHNVLSTVRGNGYDTMGGSSQAAPQISALIGYMLADDPGLSIGQIRRRVLDWAGPRPTLGGADFTWSMPNRTNRDVDANGMVDYLKTQNQVDPGGFVVELNACDASANGNPPGSYRWHADGELLGESADCTFRWQPDEEGTYDVQLTVRGLNDQEASISKQVKVEDLLIVSVGDSIASGEGNPDIASPFSRWQENRCHRSAYAGPAQAARLLEASAVESSVTLLHLACSGARMTGDLTEQGLPKLGPLGIGGLLTPYEGVVPDNAECENSGRSDLNACEPPQLDRAKQLVGDRTPDALLVSIGANDMRFSTILINCLLPENDCSSNEEGNGLFEERIAMLPGRYDEIAAKIQQLFPDMPSDRVIITQYADPTTTHNGVNLSCGAASGISQTEAEWAHETVMPALNNAVAAAAQRHGWTVATGIPQAFNGHGYCSNDSWIVSLTQSPINQGGKDGAFHPNYRGHSAYAKEIVRTVRDRLNLAPGTATPWLGDRAPRVNAFRSLAAGGTGAARIADLNDVSKDGNRRIERTINADGQVAEKPDEKFAEDPKEKTAPDGRVDMRDLRRFRDAWLQTCLTGGNGCPSSGNIKLDGADDHPKKDLNLDGCVKSADDECGAAEKRYARADLNGDQLIDPAKKMLVPWKQDGKPAGNRSEGVPMTDLDVLKAAWTGGDGAEGWKKDDLDADLLQSGDVTVDANAVLETGASKAVVQVRELGGDLVGPERTIRRTDGSIVMTVPLDDLNTELEIVSKSKTARGDMKARSAPFTLKIGEDKTVAVCPELSIDATTRRVPGDGQSTSVITATLHKCAGRTDVSAKDIEWEMDAGEGDATLEPIGEQTDAKGKGQATFTAGDHQGTYTIKAKVHADEDADPLEAEIEVDTVPTLKIKYLWKQSIDHLHESGTTRWPGGMDPMKPDCLGPGVGTTYCIDSWTLNLVDQQLGGTERAGTLTGGGDQFKLTEQVSNSSARSRSDYTATLFETEEHPEEVRTGYQLTRWFIPDGSVYADKPVPGVKVADSAERVRLTGLQRVAELPYTYNMVADDVLRWYPPRETHQSRHEGMLIPQHRPINFGTAPEKEIVFPRADDPEAGFRPFSSCGLLDENYITERGYYVNEGANPNIPGATTISRKPDFVTGDRPMPVGPRQLKISYKFAAVAYYEGEPEPALALPECTEEGNPPVADFDVKPAGGATVAREGRTVHLTDTSTDPDQDITKYEWDFGDGKSGTGATAAHLFEDDGEYEVKLTVTDAKGNSDTKTRTVTVENEDPEADIKEASALEDHALVNFTMLDPGKKDNSQLRWELSSTNPDFPGETGTDRGGVWWRGPYTGLPAGTYPLRLVVTDKDGARASDEATLVVTETEPEDPDPVEVPQYATCDTNVTLDAEERTFLDLVNEYREKNDLSPVGVSATLTRAADRHAKHMSQHDYMGHDGKDGSTPATRAWDAGYPRNVALSENVSETDTAENSLAGWRSSSTGHNENMLHPDWRAIGIARDKGSKWRWATTYAAQLDCPATDAERLPIAPPAAKRTLRDAPGAPEGGIETFHAPAPEVEADVEKTAAAPAPIATLAVQQEDAEQAEAAAAPSLYPPTMAVSVEKELATAGVAHEVSNRSRDLDGSEIAAEIDFGDDSDPVAFGPGETRTHAYPASEDWDWFELSAVGHGSNGRAGKLEQYFQVAPVRAPYLDVATDDDVKPVSGRPYPVTVTAYDDETWRGVSGLEVTFTLEDRVVTATTDAFGRATANVALLERGGKQTIAIASKATAERKASTTSLDVTVLHNHAPVAKAGGPYVVGEGRDLQLNGTKSTDEDPVAWDRITAYDWDLDDDGDFDDASGRLANVPGDQVAAKVCGGTCQAGHLYPIKLRVKDAHELTGVATSTVKVVADFDLVLGGENKVVVPNKSNSFAVTVIGSQSYSKPVSLSVVGLPNGITATWSKNPITPTGVSVLTLTGGPNLQAGSFALRVKATDGELEKEITQDVNVAFGLVPVCKGTITGIVRDKTTGAPMSGVKITVPSSQQVTTDADGRYIVDDAKLGDDNARVTQTVSAVKSGHWSVNGTGEVACGAVTTVNLQMLDVRKGTVGGEVTDKETGAKIGGATVREAGEDKPLGVTGNDGKYQYALSLAQDNAQRGTTISSSKDGYWAASKLVYLKENVPATADLQLLKKCQGTLEGGQVLWQDTNEPAVGAKVDVYITSSSTPDVTATSGTDGKFVVDRQADLGSGNSPINYRANPRPPVGAPEGTVGLGDFFRLTKCGDKKSVTVYLKRPKPSLGTIDGTAKDYETGAPLKGATIELCTSGHPYCRTTTAGDEGEYEFKDVFNGYDGASANHTVKVSPPGYFDAALGTLLKDKETKTLHLKALKRKTGKVEVRAVDSITGTPLPGVSVSEVGGCGTLCLTTDREGRKTSGDLSLNLGNQPRSFTLTAAKDGYWGQTKTATITAGNTTVVEYALQPECEPAKIVGTVVNAQTGDPIDGARVQGGGADTSTNDEGRFTIGNVKPSHGNNPRDVSLTASAAGFYTQTKTVTIWCGATVTVEFGSPTSKTGVIYGTVTDEVTGEPLEDAFVASTYGAKTETNADGEYTLTGAPLNPGNEDRDWEVQVKPAGHKAKVQTATVEADVETELNFAFGGDNATPAAESKTVELDEDTTKPVTVQGTDADGDPLTYHVVKWPQHGALTGKLPNVTYDPDNHWNGTDSFEYVVSDGAATSTRGTVELVVDPVNDAPTAYMDNLKAQPGRTTRFPAATLLANDVDHDGDELTVTGATTHVDGAAVEVEDDGDVLFTPPAGWDSETAYLFFRYTISDGTESDEGAVYLQIKSEPAAPECEDASFSTLEGQALADDVACEDPNGDDVTYALVDGPADGTLDLDEDGSFTYTPADEFTGTATFTFRASDPGGLESEVATATIAVDEDNVRPACADVSATTAEDTAVGIDLDCADADEDELTYTIGSPAHGKLEALGGKEYRYTPDADWSGTETLAFSASDAGGKSADAELTITVTPANDLPVCEDVSATTAEDTAVGIDLDCADADEDELTYTIGSPAHGKLEALGGKEYRYTPDADWSGTETLAFSASDAGGKSADAELTITVTPVNDLPVCKDVALASDGSAAEVAPDCADLEGDALTVEVAEQGAKGATAVAAGKLRYTPADGKSGADVVAYRARDAGGASAAAKVAVTITRKGGPVIVDPPKREDPVETTPDPAPAPAPVVVPRAEAPALPAPVQGSAALLSCADRPVVLEDVIPAGKRVKLLGLVGPEHAGRKVEIRLEGSSKLVAAPVVDGLGRFRASAPVPTGFTNRDKVRYVAKLGDDASRALRLWRRLQVSDVRASGDQVIISGRVTGPLAAKKADRVIEVRRQAEGCKTGGVLAKVTPDAKGRFTVKVPRGKDEQGAVYRLKTTVRNATRRSKSEVTYSLPRVIDF